MRIGMIVPFPAMGELAVRLGQEHGVSIFYQVGEVTSAERCLANLRQEYGIEAVIVRNPVGHFLRDHSDIPVLSMNISRLDLIRAARKLKGAKRVGFFHIEPDSRLYDHGVEELDELTGYHFEIIRLSPTYPYNLTSREYLALPEYEQVLRCDALITSTPSVMEFYTDHNKQVEYIDVDPQTLESMILNAVNAVEVRNREMRNTQLTELALNSTNDSFIAICEGQVIMVNNNLCRLAGLSKADLLQKSCTMLANRYPIFRKIFSIQRKGLLLQQGVNYSVFRRSMAESGEGVELITIIDVPNIQKTESSIRKALDNRGFEAKWTFGHIVATSQTMKAAVEKARRFASSCSNLLILGESGTGKEMFAQSIHNASGFSSGPFVAINCAALPENLLESELYGYEEGAFTGARKGGKAGLFELSHNGTLFLDEIGELSPALQAKLLRSIQERRIARVGGERLIPITNRLICATHRNLSDLVKNRTFREDLFYRIDVLHIMVPPLRERRDGIPDLAQALLEGLRDRLNCPVPEIPADQLGILRKYDWPGNVRELEAFLERFAAANASQIFHLEVFRALFQEITVGSSCMTAGETGSAAVVGERLTVQLGTMEDMERQLLLHTYETCGANIQQTANTLGLGRSTVWRKLKGWVQPQ